jgi:hypothetical protein
LDHPERYGFDALYYKMSITAPKTAKTHQTHQKILLLQKNALSHQKILKITIFFRFRVINDGQFFDGDNLTESFWRNNNLTDK